MRSYDRIFVDTEFWMSSDLFKTKLMKLLHYSDMLFYKENGSSISGLKYIHRSYGPVPVYFDLLLGRMDAEQMIHIEVTYDGSCEKHQIIADRPVPEGSLSAAETEMLERVCRKFRDFGPRELSAYAQKEKGHLSTKNGEIIPYSYARDIELA